MDKDLEKYLKILNSERCLKKPKEAGAIIDKICECFSQEKSQFVIGLFIGLLLEEHNALFTFIWKTSSEFETISSTTAAFKLLEFIISNFPSSVEPYVPVLFEKCIFLLDKKFARVKEVSLKLIKNLILADSRHKLNLSKLISELERHLRSDGRIQGSVAEQIYSLLGYLFEKYPETVKNKEWFLQHMCESLRNDCTVTKNPSLSRVKGAFEGINGYLNSFSLPNSETAKSIYEYIKKLSKFRQDKRVASRVGMKILQTHWSHFSEFLYNDREFWRINLEVWTKQKKDDRVPAFHFLCAFYSVIALFSKQDSNNSEAESYIKEFRETLESDCNAYEKRAALVGIKLFVLTDTIKGADFYKTYESVMNFIKKHESYTNFAYFPLCIECVSAFVLKISIENVSVEQLSYLQRLSVKLIDTYPTFEPDLQPDVHVALEKSFYLLALSNSQILENHIGKVLYQGLLRTCSSMTATELELLKEAGQASSSSASYKSYLNLWKYLLNLSSSSVLPVNGSYTLRNGVATRVFDAFVESFLKIISKLNFRVGENKEVEKPSDLLIFINAIDLYQDLIPLVNSFLIQKWLSEILKTVISLSYKNPLVSGFYKIIAVSLRVGDSFEFFDDASLEKKKCLEIVKTFLENILPRIDQYKGDLQMSCLNMILSAPVKVIESFVEKTIPPLETALYLARSCFPLLKDLIEALERWDLHLPSATSSAIMQKILPSFDIFFQSPYFSGSNLVDTSIEGKKLKINLIFSDSELLVVQKKFLAFLGHLDINKAMNLIELRDVEENALGDRDLVYLLPFTGGGVEINLNEVMPRVMNLALYCSDRKTRITACELLHAEVMVLLGNIKQLSGVYSVLFKQTMRSCLMLGCDSDGVICQIFEPLMFQIVRYFSGKEALNFSESNDVIDVLMDYVTRPYNPTLRDFSAHLIKEFTVWSVKQVTPEELKVAPKSVSRVLKNIYSLALHPSFNKRLGAAVVFNRIYSILREEEFILNAYWFQLFYYFMESLRMCEGPEDVTEILEAIQHVKRPLVERCAMFNEDSPEREVPSEFEGRRLCHLVKWTMERACDIQPATRRTAMALVAEMAPLVENCDSTMSFVSKQFRDFFNLKENSFQSNFSEDNFIIWLNYQLAGFEYCTWLVEQKVLTTEEVLQPQFIAVLKSYILGVISPWENAIAVDVFRQKSVLAFLNLLWTLKERAYMYPPVLWDLLKVAVFTPTTLGFHIGQTNTEELSCILTKLLKHFFVHLTTYDWEHFYKDLETVVSVPAFNWITRSQEIDVKNFEFLFAFRIVEASGFWVSFKDRMFFPADETLFITPIFRSLFVTRGKTVFAIPVEPSCRFFLEEVLQIMLNVSEDLKGILACIENEEEVVEEETRQTVKKGEFFLFLFKNTIFNFLGKKHNVLLDRILQVGTMKAVNLLVQIIENISEDSDLPAAVLQRWHEFETLKIKDSLLKNKLLLQLAFSCAKAIGILGLLKATPIAETIYSVIENKQSREISMLEAAFNLLPYLSDFSEVENDRLSECLLKFEVDQNALKGSAAQEGFKLRTMKLVVSGVLESLKATGSLVLFRFAINRAAWFDAVCRKEDMDSALTVFAERTPLTHSVNVLKLAYSFCFENEKAHSASVIYKLFVNPLMRLLPNAAVYQLVNENLESLCDIMTAYWGEEKNLSKIKSNMIRKICAAGVFQVFVTKLTKAELDEMPRERRQLIDGIVKKVFLLLKHPYPPKVLEERYRKMMCEIFNMICCIISARCKEEKFYKLFIFDERGSFLYAAVDKTSTYNFAMDFEEIPKRKKLPTILRGSVSGGSQMRGGRNLIKYIETNTLFTSSLMEDVTKFDFTQSFICPVDSVPQETIQNLEIELEIDSINSHECMPFLVATISKMAQDKITSSDDVTQLPCWLRFFLSILSNPDLCENIKFLVLKAIYNVQDFVAPYCKKTLPVILESILELFKNRPLSYFLIDLIELMIGWMHLPEEEKSRWQLTELVVLILNKSDSFRRDILRNNLQVLKAMVEAWRSVLHLPELSSVAFKRLSKSVERDLKSNANGDGLTYFNAHTCGILLSNGIPAWEEGSKKQFFELVCRNIREESRHNELFGEMCGLALKETEKSEPDALEEFEQMVRDRIFSLPVCWLQVLYGVHKHHPKMSSFFTYKIFSSAWDSTDSLIVHKLEMLLSHVSREEPAEDSTFERHAHMFLIDMLNSPNGSVQVLSLQIVDKLLDKFDDDKLINILKEIMRLQRSVYSDVRKWVYKIAMKLYGKSNELKKHCRIILLKGLSDGVKELEDSCLEFWRSVLDLTTLGTYLLQVLKTMYTPETEDIFLSNSIKILLQFAADSGQLEKHIFLHPISQKCSFKKRNLILTPRHSVFRSTMSRTLENQSVELIATLKSQNLPFLRPTASSLTFEPTARESSDEVSSSQPASSVEEVSIPSNPYKRRFYKSEAKTNFSYATWQRRKKKKEMGVREEMAAKKETALDIIGEYRDGDFPDIQLRHSHILKLFESLAKKDHYFARQFLVSLFSGLIRAVGTAEKKTLLEETGKCFEEMLKSSASFDPGVFGFALQLILEHTEDFNINCQLISNAAISSNWLSLGTLIIEAIIAKETGSGERSPKRRKGLEAVEEVQWRELAKLYRSLEEFDVLSGIFQDKLNVPPEARDAINCEGLLNWEEASKQYESVLRAEPESSLSDFYTESYFSCLAKLSNWSLLNECIKSTVGNELDELWKNYNLLSWFLKSEMMISLESGKDEFLDTLEEFSKNAAKRGVLFTNFGEELTAFDLVSNKFQRASYRIDRLCLDFLAGWSHLDQWSYNLRAVKLAGLQTLSELGFAVRNLAAVSQQELEENIKTGRKRWEKNLPTPNDDLTIWDVKLRYRRQFIKRLKDFDLAKVEVLSYLALARAALDQSNLSMAKEYLSWAKDSLPEGDDTLRAQYDDCFIRGKMVVARLRVKNENVGLEIYLNVWRNISKQISTFMETDLTSLKSRLYSCNFILGQLVSEVLQFVKMEPTAQTVLESVRLMLDVPEGTDVVRALERKSLQYFETAKAAIEGVECPSTTKANVYLELTKFLLKFSSVEVFSEFEKLYVYTLKSMAHGSAEARQLFGCLLNISNDSFDASFCFDAILLECDRVPSWMFLSWINQMLASLSSDVFKLLKLILLRITQDYPNAIRYPLKLAEERGPRDAKIKSFLIRLSGMLSKDRLYGDFWNAMKYLAPPDVILRFYLGNALEEATQGEPDPSRITKIISDLQEIMFSTNYDKFRGPVFIWENFKEPLENLLTSLDNKEVLIRKLKNLLLSTETSKWSAGRGLSSYSPWLCSFHSLRADTPLELPGQYDGSKQPIKKYIVTVTSFRNNILTFNSKCRPMRITILGNDATEHKFLVKFGEDLRQDERIQQVFRHFGYRLRESRQTERFTLQTYKVIPLTFSLGMIEWVENTVSLYEMMESSLENGKETLARAQNAHLTFLSQGSPLAVPGSLNASVAAHLTAYEKIKRETAISHFKLRVQEFPENLLRKSLLSLSSSPEHFVHLRKNFLTSHAVMCITHWLVGIGDRHLQNTLVSTKTGFAVGIDFGYAFGFATQFLTPPELVPFRLSPQILGLAHPLEESGWIKQTMIHCLRLFRKDHFGLLSILEVFAQEPLMDWLKQAKKSQRCRAENPDTWYPREKLSLVEKKLNGANPVSTFEDDLKAGHSHSKYLKKYLEVLKGVEQENIRARRGENGLSEKEQIECLIDLATDPHVLSKTFIGWNSWL